MTDPSASAVTRRPPRRRTTRTPTANRFRDVITGFLGTIGILLIAWMIASAVFNLSVIVFVTGSMSPTMPAGAAAIVQVTAAGDVTVGDVVTVPRHDSGRPVTHRVVAVKPVPGESAARSLTLRGDANSMDDARPYVVHDVQRVLASAPVVGNALMWTRSPVVMTGVSLLSAAVVGWALWPTRRANPADSDPGESEAGESGAVEEPADARA